LSVSPVVAPPATGDADRVTVINIPELSWPSFSHPPDIVSVGQQVDAEILDVDPVRERVSLSLKKRLWATGRIQRMAVEARRCRSGEARWSRAGSGTPAR
jgi:transcriptional accessory protein Tex/SPT6